MTEANAGSGPAGPVSLEQEHANAEAAVAEMERLGKTDRRCLRCGGRLIYEDFGTAYVIRCENGDFKLTARGI